MHENFETGGIFLGKFHNNNWYIAETIPSGPNAVHKSAEFMYDHEYVTYQADTLLSLYEVPLDIIGIWHSHITSSPFSYADEDANKKFADLHECGALSCLVDMEKGMIHMFHVSHRGQYEEIPFSVKNGLKWCSAYSPTWKGRFI